MWLLLGHGLAGAETLAAPSSTLTFREGWLHKLESPIFKTYGDFSISLAFHSLFRSVAEPLIPIGSSDTILEMDFVTCDEPPDHATHKYSLQIAIT